MLSAYSWGDFILAIICAAAAYYVYVAFRYYPKELEELRTGKKGKNKERVMHAPHSTKTSADSSTADSVMFADELMKTIKTIILSSAEDGLDKQELMDTLRVMILPYRQYDDEVFRNMVNEFILEQCFKNNGATLDEDEVAGLWYDEG